MPDYYVDSVLGSDLNSGLTSNSALSTLARLQQFISGDTSTYFVDPATGSDLNDGQTKDTAWASTIPADLVALDSWNSVSYNLSDVWYLYRKPDMRMDEWLLPFDLVTNRMNNF